MHFENIYADRAPNEIMDELGWAEHLTPQDLSRALMQTLRIIQVQQAQLDDLRNELDAFHEVYPLPNTGDEPTVNNESV